MKQILKQNLPILKRNYPIIIFAIWLLSLAFSFVYIPHFLRSPEDPTSFVLFGISTFDLMTVIFLFVFLTKKGAITLYKKSFFDSDNIQLYLKIIFYTFLFSLLPLTSAFWSGDEQVSGINGARFLLIFLSLLLLITLIQVSKVYKNIFQKTIIFLGIAEGAISLGQFLFQRSIGFYLFGESHLEPGVPGLARFYFAGHKILRAYGTLPHPNILGGFFLFTLAITYWHAKSKNILRRNSIKLIFTIQFLGLLLTFSRTAVLGLIIIVGIIWKNEIFDILHKKKNLKIAAIAFACLFLVIFMRSPIQSIIQMKDETVKLRIEYIKASVRRFEASPILGRGWATDVSELPAFSIFPFYPWEQQPVHNIYLLVLSDLGVVGMVFFYLFVKSIFRGRRTQHTKPGTRDAGHGNSGDRVTGRPGDQENTNTDESKFNNKFQISASHVSRLGSRITLVTRSPHHQVTSFSPLFIAYLFIGLFDHYLLTTTPGIFIFLASALISAMQRQEELIHLKEK